MVPAEPPDNTPRDGPNGHADTVQAGNGEDPSGTSSADRGNEPRPGMASETAMATAAPDGQIRPAASLGNYGRYELIGELGAGGMGVVYEAYDPELDRRVALKVIGQSQHALGRPAQQRLLREARAMAKLSHPNVIAIHDVGSVGGHPFVAMELVQGTTLKSWLRARPRSVDDVLQTFTQAGRGLAAAHAAGLIHRDFKPANVMVGDDGRVRVLDFGLARFLADADPAPAGAATADASASLHPLTRTGGILGTPAYMAPEQCVGGNTDERTDQFCFCVALYEALYDTPPFSGDSIDERAAHIEAGRLNDVATASAVPKRVRAAVVRGLRANPDDRHPSLDALLLALAAAGPPRRRRARVAGSALVLLLWLAGAFLAWQAADDDKDAASAARAAAVAGERLRMQMVDSAGERMASLCRHADQDPEARRMGIHAQDASWQTEGGDKVTEHYLIGSDRAVLERYLVGIAQERSDLSPEPGHEIRLEQRDGQWRTHYLWTRVELDGTGIASAEVQHNDSTGAPEVVVRFNDQGAARLAAVTGQNTGRRLATLVDGIVISSAVIAGPIHGGVVTLSLGKVEPDAAEQQAQNLASRLQPR